MQRLKAKSKTPRPLAVHEQLAADVLTKATDHLLMAQSPMASLADKRANLYEAVKYMEIAEMALLAQSRVELMEAVLHAA